MKYPYIAQENLQKGKPGLFSILSIIIFSLLTLQVKAQSNGGKTYYNDAQYWIRYINELKISKKWGVTTEIDNRRSFEHAQVQFITRSTATYKIGKVFKVGLGLAYSRVAIPNLDHDVPELRPEQQITARHKAFGLQLDHRLKIEERFFKTYSKGEFDPGLKDYRTRARYAIGFTLPINKEIGKSGFFALHASEEIMYQLTDEILAFDQNRIYGGVIVQPTGNISLEAGYMKFFQQTNKVTNDFDIVRFTLRHYLPI